MTWHRFAVGDNDRRSLHSSALTKVIFGLLAQQLSWNYTDRFLLYFLQCGLMDVLSVDLRMVASRIADLTVGFLTKTVCSLPAMLHHR